MGLGGSSRAPVRCREREKCDPVDMARRQEVRERTARRLFSCRSLACNISILCNTMEFRLVTAAGVDEAYQLEIASFSPDEAASLETMK